MVSTVGSEGQVVIEQHIRDALGIKPGWVVVQHLVDGHVENYFVPPEHNESLVGVLAPHATVSIPDEEALHEATERAWADEVSERWGGRSDTTHP